MFELDRTEILVNGNVPSPPPHLVTDRQILFYPLCGSARCLSRHLYACKPLINGFS